MASNNIFTDTTCLAIEYGEVEEIEVGRTFSTDGINA
jgi:hypothetical protein